MENMVKLSKKTEAFLSEIKLIDWLKNSGKPNENYYMLFSLYSACDDWGKQYLEVWEPQIYVLEDIATQKIGDKAIDEVFNAVSTAIGDIVWDKFSEYIIRQHLDTETAVSFELFDNIKRDMAWACIERILDISGFFTMLAEIYRQGYFPCSWTGTYPSGRAVVL